MNQSDRFPPPSKQPIQPAGSNQNKGKTLADSDKEGGKPDPNEAGGEAGEDEGSAPKEGHDDHLKEDQKPLKH